MKKPKVTIVIPVYNGEKYVKEAIDSGLNQTYKNIEILVINDGSTDNTESIVKEYTNKVKYIHKENGGVSTVLNLAIKEMSGEYFSWLSHDDRYYPKKVETEINYLIDKKLLGTKTILYSDYDLIDEKSKVLSKAIKDHKMLEEKEEYALLRGTVNGITLLIPKIAFKECGNFDESLRCAQDYDLWYRMMKKGYKYKHIPEILASTRIHKKQVTNTNPKVITEGNNFWIKMIDDIPLNIKEKLENSEYSYYYEMAVFLKTTPYDEARLHCEKKYLEIEKKTDINKIKISVIIPFYNRINLVKRAINSVINQSHKNWEILLINDGTKENTEDLKSFIKNNKKIKLIEFSKNKGASSARNAGINAASGEYIAFLDSDDEFTKDKLKTQLTQMVLKNYKISHTSYIREGIGNENTIMHSGIQTGKMIPKLIESCQIATPTVMIKTDYLKNNNYQFNPNLIYGEDTCFWITILKSEKLLGIDMPLAIVHANENSAAYDIKKQIIGIKTILNFVLNDSELSKYDIEISHLTQYYIYLVKSSLNSENNDDNNIDTANSELTTSDEKYLAVINSHSWKITAPLRKAKNGLNMIKNEGFIYFCKRLLKKIKCTLKKK